MANYKNKETDILFETIANLKTKKECYDFFEDLCTINEILDMSKRLSAAVLLDKNESYNEIIKKIGISTATLSRINKSLHYGTGGYKVAIDKINNKKSEDK